MVISKKIRVMTATDVVEYIMYENYYSNKEHETTYSIAKRNYQQDKLIEWLVRGVRRDTAELVWRDRCDDNTWVHTHKR